MLIGATHLELLEEQQLVDHHDSLVKSHLTPASLAGRMLIEATHPERLEEQQFIGVTTTW